MRTLPRCPLCGTPADYADDEWRELYRYAEQRELHRYAEQRRWSRKAVAVTLPSPADGYPRCRCQRGCCAVCTPGEQLELAELPPDWPTIREEVLRRDGRRCQHCGTRERLTVHHITPRPLGTHDPRNLITLCEGCHNVLEQPAENEEAGGGPA
jgi:HNH endonuclease